MGKGSRRRPMQVSRQEFDRNWEAAFGKDEGSRMKDEGEIPAKAPRAKARRKKPRWPAARGRWPADLCVRGDGRAAVRRTACDGGGHLYEALRLVEAAGAARWEPLRGWKYQSAAVAQRELDRHVPVEQPDPVVVEHDGAEFTYGPGVLDAIARQSFDNQVNQFAADQERLFLEGALPASILGHPTEFPPPDPEMVKLARQQAAAGNGTTIDEILAELPPPREQPDPVCHCGRTSTGTCPRCGEQMREALPSNS